MRLSQDATLLVPAIPVLRRDSCTRRVHASPQRAPRPRRTRGGLAPQRERGAGAPEAASQTPACRKFLPGGRLPRGRGGGVRSNVPPPAKPRRFSTGNPCGWHTARWHWKGMRAPHGPQTGLRQTAASTRQGSFTGKRLETMSLLMTGLVLPPGHIPDQIREHNYVLEILHAITIRKYIIIRQ